MGDSRYWLDHRLQTLAGMVYASVNLDFYGIGRDDALKDNPLAYNLQPLGFLLHVKCRLGDSKVYAGLGYAFADTRITFDAPAATPGLPDFRKESLVGGVTPSITYDSRDSIFTLLRRTYLDASAGLFCRALGGDGEFERVKERIVSQAGRTWGSPRKGCRRRNAWAASSGRKGTASTWLSHRCSNRPSRPSG